MKTAGIREARQGLSSLLAEVRKGREIVLTEHGRPVARLVPPPSETDKTLSMEDLLKRLESEGHLRRATRKPRSFKPIATRGKSASQMILEDRD